MKWLNELLGFAVLTGPLWLLLILLPVSIWIAIKIAKRFKQRSAKLAGGRFLCLREEEKLTMRNFVSRVIFICVAVSSAALSMAADRDEVQEMTDRANAGVWVISMQKSYEALARTCSDSFPDMQKDFEMALAGLNDRNREIVTKAEIARESILQYVEKSGGKEKAKTYAQVLEGRIEQEVANTIKK